MKVFAIFCEKWQKPQNLKIICAKINVVEIILAEFSFEDDTHHPFMKVK